MNRDDFIALAEQQLLELGDVQAAGRHRIGVIVAAADAYADERISNHLQRRRLAATHPGDIGKMEAAFDQARALAAALRRLGYRATVDDRPGVVINPDDAVRLPAELRATASLTARVAELESLLADAVIPDDAAAVAAVDGEGSDLD